MGSHRRLKWKQAQVIDILLRLRIYQEGLSDDPERVTRSGFDFLPVRIPQMALVKLARRVPRYLFHEIDLSGDLHLRDLTFEVLLD